ncbi:squalene--hopene cyclase [Pontibacillus yanchengensis]|uniref:Squalene--hopene cyclase n=1 Tax=Pontibacillus yanchengensis TaxID=462910 RepID=A0ACC7VAW6_9BACI|nr:prenyltransferase/squalene oxidase repeat-containing protein [Pontibacillus yanchengensis]MYL51812.1 squalene--hopene cyclase [Pontibacillus yanchengensis]
MKEQLYKEKDRLIEEIKAIQTESGSWHLCFENSLLTDAFTIILYKTLKVQDGAFIEALAERIASKQLSNGAWKLYPDEDDGNVSLTINAYYALLTSGTTSKEDPLMKKASSYIKDNGGLMRANTITKLMLAVTGNLPWSSLPSIPIELILVPKAFPLSFYDLVGYARVHLAPILILMNSQFQLNTKDTPDLSDLLLYDSRFYEDLRNQTRFLKSWMKDSLVYLSDFQEKANDKEVNKAKDYMFERIEPNGLLYGYFLSSFYMVFALLALDYKKQDSLIRKALVGMKTLICYLTPHSIHIQNSPSTIWDTALLSSALQVAGVDFAEEPIQRANSYLLSRQHFRYGDWSFHNSHTPPGKWGFSDVNTMEPDVDDTTAALRSLKKLADEQHNYRSEWNRGLKWVLSMQNDDGGWPAFEKNTNKRILTLLPIDGADVASVDLSTPDLTGRTLQFLGDYAKIPRDHPQIKNGVNWLLDHQRTDGSWNGRWGICYIYGTWAAVTGLEASGLSDTHLSLKLAKEWLERIQNEDGGWGESCRSDQEEMYIPLKASTPSQTAWALEALIAISPQPTRVIDRGMIALLNSLKRKNWTHFYPTGAALPGQFYIYYHSYNYSWPLKTIARYCNIDIASLK